MRPLLAAPIPACRELPLSTELTTPIQWSADGRYLYLRVFGEIPAEVRRYEIATGAETSFLSLGPEDPTAFMSIGRVLVSRDGRSYAFNAHEVQDSSLFVVEGLR